jgi:hypothetical protein
MVINSILSCRSTSDGHAIELDTVLADGTRLPLQIPFVHIQFVLRRIWDAAAEAETIQRQSAGERMVAFVAPYQMRDVRVGSSLDGTIALDFQTEQGPVQIAMTPDLARLTIERLKFVVEKNSEPRRPS